MPNKQIDDLPSEVREQLPEGAQQVFLAALNSAQEDGMSEEAAMSVAWNSISSEYVQGSDGKWQHKEADRNAPNKGVTTGGN